MVDPIAVPSVVVGIDGSRAATQAAVWAVDEAVSRDIPLRLVYVIDSVDLATDDSDHRQFACARAALYDAQRSVVATGEPVKVDTEILSGKPLAKLAQESRSAPMVCVGSIGARHARHGTGSVAAALPALAQCPVAVIRPQRRAAKAVRSVVVEVDNGVVLRHAFDEARLRKAPLLAVASWQAEVPDDIADGNRLARAHLNRRIDRWARLYPDVAVESLVVRGSLCEYLAKNATSVEIFVTGIRGGRCDLVGPGPVECSVLTVRGNHL
ncbi:universal stress protein [Mycobacterium sp.]|uniref:universal stress protein n=1 Tax=Mycobacterium sp. TaxID=1785 RepID=UPI003D6A3A58